MKYLCKECGLIPEDLLKKCTPSSDNKLNSSNEELLTHKGRCLEKELDISREHLTKYRNAECIKPVNNHMHTQTTSTWKTYEQLTDKSNKLEDVLQKKEDE